MLVEAGSGPRRRPWRASRRLTWPSTTPGWTRSAGPVVLDADPAPVAADVDQDRVGLALAVEAGAAGAEGPATPELGGAAQELGHVADVARDGHRLRDQAVGARVGGVADQVQRPGEDPVGAERGDQARSAAARACPPRPSRVPGRAPGAGGSGTIVSAIGRRLAVTTPATSRRPPAPAPAAGRRRRRSTSRSASVSSSRPRHVAGGDTVAAGHRGDVEAGQVEPGRARAPARAWRTT